MRKIQSAEEKAVITIEVLRWKRIN
jgi:hypothetical protein